MLRRLANDAMRSDPNAIRLLLSLIDRYSDSPEAFNAKNITGTVVILQPTGKTRAKAGIGGRGGIGTSAGRY
jgi:hypothetical protein